MNTEGEKKMLKENRGLLKYMLLNMITLGVYSIVFWWDVV